MSTQLKASGELRRNLALITALEQTNQTCYDDPVKRTVERSRRTRQSELGQFFTTEFIARFMASMFDALPRVVRVLDAGAGIGTLTRAFVERCCETPHDVKTIHVTLYELDSALVPRLNSNLDDCERRCRDAGIQFFRTVHNVDFIEEVSAMLSTDLFGIERQGFDVAIVNPPYRKITADSKERAWLRSVGIETSNLYTAFMTLVARILSPGGQIVAITPRSFCNGPYFRQFREELLRSLDMRRIHVFGSRQAVFRKDRVLQENIIVHAVKRDGQSEKVFISSSSGEPRAKVNQSWVPFNDVVANNDPERFIHIPTRESHAVAKGALSGFGAKLADLGIMVSTGRVVDFRLSSALRTDAEPNTVPLIYPCHCNGGTVHWPKRGSRKPNAILDALNTRPWLVPRGLYLLVKRFTTKEERKRVVACLLDPGCIPSEWLGIENHLNYFHSNGNGLDHDTAMGLYVYLNSSVVDEYFRRFSGHTQVNATDLRCLPYPRRDIVHSMGRVLPSLMATQAQIDQIVTNHLHEKQ